MISIKENEIEWNLKDPHYLKCYYPDCDKTCPHVGSLNGGHLFVCLEHGNFFINKDGEIENFIDLQP